MKQKAKRMFVLLLSIILLFGLVACEPKAPSQTEEGGPTSSTKPDTTSGESLIGSGKKVAMISGFGGFGDGAINDTVLNGLKKAQELLGFDFNYSEALTPVDYEQLLSEYADSKEYDIIFLCSADGIDPVNALGPDYPDQKFVLYDVQVEGNPQLISQYFAKDEMGFIAGVLAALMDAEGSVTIDGIKTEYSPSGKIGLVVGVEIPSAVPVLIGAAAGIKYVRPDYEWLYGIAGSWSDNTKNKELALSMYDSGANFVFHNAGGGAMGIVAAAREQDRFMIGYDSDQTVWDPARVIGSTRKQSEGAIVRVMTQYFETGELAWGTAEENNASNDGVFFQYNVGFEVPSHVSEILESVIMDLKEGKISIPSSWEEVEEFDLVFGS